MRALFLLFGFFLLIATSGCNTTKRIVNFESDALNSMRQVNVDLPSMQNQYGNVEGVYLNYDQTLEHNVSIAFTSTIPDWKFYQIVDRSRVVFNPSAQEMTTFRLELPSYSELKQAVLKVQAPGATSMTYTEEDLFEEEGPDGQKIYTFNYPSVSRGTVIKESYEVIRGDLERNPPVMHDVPLQYGIPTESLTFQYIYPVWWQVQVKDLSMDQPLNYERIEDSAHRKVILRYTDQNVPAFVPVPNGPSFKQAAPYFQLQVTNLSMGSAVRYRAAEDWTEFAKDYRRYAVDPEAQISSSIESTSNRLAVNSASDRERVESLLNFLADNIQIREDSKPRSLDQVLDRRAGNSFMVTGLMQAMLDAVNIDSEYLLVHPASEGYFDPEFYSDVQLRIPALGVFVDGEQYYVFPGRQRSLSESIPMEYNGQTAMVITNEGFGGFSEIYSDQAPGTPVPVAIANNGAGDESDQNLAAANQQAQAQEPAGQDGTGGETLNQPVSTTGGGVVGSPIGNQPVNTQPDPAPPVQQPPAVVEVTESTPDPNALPEWVGSIDRSRGGWTWIVASKTSLPEAEDEANTYIDLYRQGLSLDVLAGQSNGVTRYRIAIGQYPNRNLAESDRDRLGPLLPSDAWLLRIEPNM